LARPETHQGVDDGEEADSGAGPPSADVVRPGTGVMRPGDVRPGTGVVRPGDVRPGTDAPPGTDVVRPGTGVVAPADSNAARARAVVPDAPDRPLEPIHVVLPVIPVKAAKQGFLDRLVAPKPKAAPKPKKEKDPSAKKDRKSKKKAREAASPEEFDEYGDHDDAYGDHDDPYDDPYGDHDDEYGDHDDAYGDHDDAYGDHDDAYGEPTDAAPAAAPPPPAPVRPPAAPPRVDQPRVDQPRVQPIRADPPRRQPVPPPPLMTPAPPPMAPPLASPTAPPPMAPSRPAPPPGPPQHSGQQHPGPPHPGPQHPGQQHPGPQHPGQPHPGPQRLQHSGQRHPGTPQGRPGGRPFMSHGGQRPISGYANQPSEFAGDDWGDDWPAEEPEQLKRLPKNRMIIAGVVAALLATGSGAVGGRASVPTSIAWLAAPELAAAAPVLEGIGTNAPVPTSAALADRLGALLGDAKLAQVTASVVDVASGAQVYGRESQAAAMPASTAKLVTGAAVLHTRGPAYRISTRVVAGSQPGEVVLIGGGDPTLAAGATGTYPGAGRLDLLAAQVKQALGSEPTLVIIDTSLYQGPSTATSWYGQDLKDGVVSKITPLMIDGARQDPKRIHGNTSRHANPDQTAGVAFAKALGLPASAVRAGTAQDGAQQLGEVVSPPISRLIEIMLLESDNVLAEGLARQVALAMDRPASFSGAAEATRDAISDLGVPIDGLGLTDGSGLSTDNRVTAALLTALLVRAAAENAPELRALISGLPVAGYSGTLHDRFLRANAGSPAAGIVRAKTGTLNGVNALAGLVVDADGRLLAFAVVANRTTSGSAAELGLDRIAAAIAGCGCA
jgi:D-alanyl-D-alanine carboxypeptidase/D-alanyl-D-alanine-endopeptidase (penicillin-binding protein 4)